MKTSDRLLEGGLLVMGGGFLGQSFLLWSNLSPVWPVFLAIGVAFIVGGLVVSPPK